MTDLHRAPKFLRAADEMKHRNDQLGTVIQYFSDNWRYYGLNLHFTNSHGSFIYDTTEVYDLLLKGNMPEKFDRTTGGEFVDVSFTIEELGDNPIEEMLVIDFHNETNPEYNIENFTEKAREYINKTAQRIGAGTLEDARNGYIMMDYLRRKSD